MRRWHVALLLIAAFVLGVLVPPVRYIGTAAPTSTATITPWPTFTATNTPGWSPMPTLPPDTPTPTPEIATFVPTITATSPPLDRQCYAGVISVGLNVRADHAKSAARLGVMAQAQRIAVSRVHVVHDEGSTSREEWGQVEYNGTQGWIALWYGGEELAVLDNSDWCYDIPYEYEENPLPSTPQFLDGFHSLAGEGAGILLAPDIVSRYKLLKCLDGGFALCEQAKRANPSIKTIYRTFQHDCPPLWVYSSPGTWWEMIAPALPPGADYYEIQNECDPPIEYAAQWAQFSIDMALIVERERGAALLAFSSGPGNPDFPYWRAMWTYVDWAQSHGPAPNGLHHGIATHSSAYAPANVVLEPGSWLNNPYIAGREKIVCDMAAANEYGASCEGLTWINTEVGVTDGYQGNKQVFLCDQKAAAYQETARRKLADGVTGFTWWNVGGSGSVWTSDDACVKQMVN